MKNGYGQFKLNRKTVQAHRFAWELYRGKIPEGKCVCHHCDTRACVNPDRAFLGTKRDNDHDMIRKGRQRILYGEHNGKAKLTEAQVRLILDCNGSQRKIASKFGISHMNVGLIKRGKAWKHSIHQGSSPSRI